MKPCTAKTAAKDKHVYCGPPLKASGKCSRCWKMMDAEEVSAWNDFHAKDLLARKAAGAAAPLPPLAAAQRQRDIPEPIELKNRIYIRDLRARNYDGDAGPEGEFIIATLSDYFPAEALKCFDGLLIEFKQAPRQSEYTFHYESNDPQHPDCRIVLADGLAADPQQFRLHVLHEALHRAHHFLAPIAYKERVGMRPEFEGWRHTTAEELLTITGHDVLHAGELATGLNPLMFNENAFRHRLAAGLRETYDDVEGHSKNHFLGMGYSPAMAAQMWASQVRRAQPLHAH